MTKINRVVGPTMVPPSRMDTRLIGAHVHPDVQRAVRVLAAEIGKPVDTLIQQGIAFMLREHGKSVPGPIRRKLKEQGLTITPQPRG